MIVNLQVMLLLLASPFVLALFAIGWMMVHERKVDKEIDAIRSAFLTRIEDDPVEEEKHVLLELCEKYVGEANGT